MRVLLTGVTGFVGKTIAGRLLAQGHEVIGLHASPRPSCVSEDIEDIILDIGHYPQVEALLGRLVPCDAVVHAAASLDMNLFATKVPHSNCAGLQNMLWLASLWRSRFVFLSSLPVIGSPRVLPITESHPTSPQTAYHASKLFGEQLVHLAQAQGVKGVSLRLTAPVGPSMPKERLLPVLLARAARHQPLLLSGAGTRKQNYIDVRDIASAVDLCLAHDRQDLMGVFNIAARVCISNLALARRCIERTKSSSDIVLNNWGDPQEGLVWDVSIEKARRELGFEPCFDIEDAITTVMADMKEDRV